MAAVKHNNSEGVSKKKQRTMVCSVMFVLLSFFFVGKAEMNATNPLQK
jgi:hypothetical protein